MQVFNEDRTQLIDTFQTIPTYRPNISNEVQLTFGKGPANSPMMLVSWFYPDENTGHEMVYSSQQESQLSEGNWITVAARNVPHVD